MISSLLSWTAQALGEGGAIKLQQSLSQALEVEPDGTGCLEQQRLEGFVRHWLGRSRVPAGTYLVVRPLAGRTRAVTIEIIKGDTRRERRLDPAPEDCTEAHAALGLVIALALDAGALQRLSSIQSDLPSRKHLLAVGLGAGYQMLPGLSAAAQVGIEAEWQSWLSGRVDLLAHFSPDNALGPSSGRYDTLLLAASVQACVGGRAAAGAVRLALCTGAGVGRLYARGRRYEESSSAAGYWIASTTNLRTEVQLGPIWTVDLGVVAPAYAPSIHVARNDAEDRVKQLDAVAVYVSVGPAFRF